MKKLLLLTIILIGIIMAETIDLDKSKGTDQEVINSLSPTPASFTVDENSTIKATFNIELQQKPISMREIKLKKIEQDSSGGFFSNFNSKKKNIDGKISYSQDKKSIIFKPNQPLDIGYYEVEFKRLFSKLTPTTPMKYKHIKNIKYRFYVPEVINGHMLPPEPDEALNNSTLLGIDMNDNGIRDDVERWIIKKYASSDYPKIKTEIALQWARTTQQVIQSPETAYADKKYLLIMRANVCEGYSFEKLQKSLNYGIDNRIFNDEFVDKAFNTKERIIAYSLFNGNLAGHVYGSLREDASKCDFDIDDMEE